MGRFLILYLLLTSIGAGPARPQQARKVRPAGVAGGFYPADPAQLRKMVNDFLAKASVPKVQQPLVALISPHAGYPYSGGVAAHAYALLRGRKFARVVVIAPSHYESFAFSSVYDGDAYSTPLGEVPVDKAFAAKLVSMSSLIKFSSRGHGEVEGHWEHALEDELPFLQQVLGDFKLVPVVMGDQSYESSRALGGALAKLIRKESPSTNRDFDTLIVASSDLSHYHPYNDAEVLDHKTLAAIEAWDYFNLSLNFQRRVWEACGGGGIVAAMIAAERLGANRATVLAYANSGDITGDKSRVVGYGAVALTKDSSQPDSHSKEFRLSGKEQGVLMDIARKSVETAVRERKLYPPPPPALEALLAERGAFVTLTEKGELRGCIGDLSPSKPLYLMVRDVAALAALRDPRFPPVDTGELNRLEYEISVLSPFRRVTDWKQIRVGRHGLVVRQGESEGVLLPQVAVEQRWDRTTFLNEVCLKAGLPSQCWQAESSDVFLFTAWVFGEHRLAEPLNLDEPFPQRPMRPQGGLPTGSPPQ
jgi:AmmeMemoRadiSam system protein B/AmmeMemoRadiSam system protein A